MKICILRVHKGKKHPLNLMDPFATSWWAHYVDRRWTPLPRPANRFSRVLDPRKTSTVDTTTACRHVLDLLGYVQPVGERLEPTVLSLTVYVN